MSYEHTKAISPALAARRGPRNAGTKTLLERAAALEGRSLTDFVLSSAQSAALDTIARHELLKLTSNDQETFVAALMKPPAPNRALRAAAARYRTARQG